MKSLRLNISIVRTLVRDRMYYPGRLFVDTVSVVARCGILLMLYGYVYTLTDGTIAGTTYPIAAWSMFLYFVFMVFQLREIPMAIMQDVRSGNVEVLFSKPISYLAYRMWWQIGTGLYPFVLIGSLGTVALAAIVGVPPTMSVGIFIPTLAFTFVLGVILTLLVYGAVGLFAFWVEDIKPIYWIVDKLVMILGGSYLPVAFFPEFMYNIALYSPFGASLFVTHSVYTTWSTEWFMKIGIQLVWVVVLGFLVMVLFRKAQTKVSVNGG